MQRRYLMDRIQRRRHGRECFRRDGNQNMGADEAGEIGFRQPHPIAGDHAFSLKPFEPGLHRCAR